MNCGQKQKKSLLFLKDELSSVSLTRSILIFLSSAVVDITDENGSLKGIHERPPDQFASEYLQGRGNYVLLKVLSKLRFYSYVF